MSGEYRVRVLLEMSHTVEADSLQEAMRKVTEYYYQSGNTKITNIIPASVVPEELAAEFDKDTEELRDGHLYSQVRTPVHPDS